MELNITLNGEASRLDGPVTVTGLLDSLGVTGKRVAVEINGKVVPRSRHDEHELEDGDRVEVVHAIGGG